MQAFIRGEERVQTNEIIAKLNNSKMIKKKASRRKEIINLRKETEWVFFL